MDGDFEKRYASDKAQTALKKQWIVIDLMEESLIVNITLTGLENYLFRGGYLKVDNIKSSLFMK